MCQGSGKETHPDSGSVRTERREEEEQVSACHEWPELAVVGLAGVALLDRGWSSRASSRGSPMFDVRTGARSAFSITVTTKHKLLSSLPLTVRLADF
jgi:hypothetical protein